MLMVASFFKTLLGESKYAVDAQAANAGKNKMSKVLYRFITKGLVKEKILNTKYCKNNYRAI